MMLALMISLAGLSAAPILAVGFTPDGQSVVVGSHMSLTVRDGSSLQITKTLNTELDRVQDLAFSSQGDRLAAVGGTPGESGVIEIYRWPSGERLQTLDLQDEVIAAVAWHPTSSEILATASADRFAALVNLTKGEIVQKFAGHSGPVVGIGFLGQGFLTTVSGDQTVRLWESSGQMIRSQNNHTQAIRALAVRPGNHPGPLMIATASEDRSVRFWQPSIGRFVRMAKLEVAPTALAWSNDGSRISVALPDGRYALIDPDTTQVEGPWPAIKGWAFCIAPAPNGRDFLVGGEQGQLVKVCPLPTGNVRKALKTQTDLLNQGEHCRIDSGLCNQLKLQIGQQVRLTRIDRDITALFTISGTDPESPDVNIRMGKAGRERLGANDDNPNFAVQIQAMAIREDLSIDQAKSLGELIERSKPDKEALVLALAPHGGDIEPFTDRQAERVAEQLQTQSIKAAFWTASGYNRRNAQGKPITPSAFQRWHITSNDINPQSFPKLAEIVDHNHQYPHVVSFHGHSAPDILIGGAGPNSLKQEIKIEVEKALKAESAPEILVRIAGQNDKLGGGHPNNIVNRWANGTGIQIEQSPLARKSHWKTIADAVSRVYVRLSPGHCGEAW